MSKTSVSMRQTRHHGTEIAVLVQVDGNGPRIDFPGNPDASPVSARTTVPLDSTDEGREVAVVFECGDRLRPLIIGVIRKPQDPPRNAQPSGLTMLAGVVSSLADNRVLVRTNEGPLSCQVLDTGVGPLALSEGEMVVVAQVAGGSPCILGAIRGPSGKGTRVLQGDKIILNAGDELILKTKQSSLVLRGNGDVEIKGERIASRARNLQKMMAPTIKLN